MSSYILKRSTVVRLILLAGACLPLIAQAGGGTLYIEKKVPFAKDLNVPQAVRAECGLEQKVVDFLAAEAKGGFDKVERVDSVAGVNNGKALSMNISSLYGAGGGAWSGAKHLAVEGTLKENGKVVGTFRAMRYSGGGAWGGYKGTCAILGRCAKTLGKDIAKWAQNPTMDARLGDAK